VRFALTFTDGSVFEMVDPRRLGGVELDPVEKLGPDLSTITLAQLQRALSNTKAPLKAALLQQDRIAGIGNLLVDEILWQCSIAPTRIAGELTNDEQKVLAHTIRLTFTKLLKRGGSHLGDHVAQRSRDGVCTKEKCHRATFQRETIGGRTTYWCPAHQT
jgi:formamidopyrimidine-DNA glycosylase